MKKQDDDGLVGLPAVAVVVATSAYFQLGEWKGYAPDLPNSLGDPKGTTWIAHPDTRNRRVILEEKPHALDSTKERVIFTRHLPVSAFSDVRMAGQLIIAYSINGVRKTSETHTTTPREVLAAAGCDTSSFFVILERGTERVTYGDEELDVEITLEPMDRFFTHSVAATEIEVEDIGEVA